MGRLAVTFLALLAFSPSVVPSSAVSVVWRLDNVSSIAGHSVTRIGEPRVVTTDIGPAVEFNGSADGLFIETNPIADLERFTIEVVFRPAADGPEEQRFVHIEESGSMNRALLELRMLEDRRWALDTYLRHGDKGVTLLDRNLGHEASAWHVASLVYDGRTMSHYVDRRKELSGEIAFKPLRTGRTSIGVRQNRVAWFKGLIHSIRITPDALPADRLMQVPRATVVQPAVSEPRIDPLRDPSRPAVFVVGDSTVKNHGPAEGWGDYIAPFFDASRIQVLNWALEGRSSRSFIGEGRWQRVLDQIKSGDLVLIQFGHNDQRDLTTDRGTIPAAGDESREVIDESSGARTVVHTYGWYLRQYARDVRAKGAVAVFCSPVPRNYWQDGRFDNVLAGHAQVMKQIAAEENAAFIDLNAMLAAIYAETGREHVTSKYFTMGDSTHPNADGARLAAMTVVDGLRALRTSALTEALKPTASYLTRSTAPVWARGIEGQRKADLGNGYYLNPIVAGDHPDPSILKDGDDYYMTFSSFDAYPGLTIWHSRDLVNWTPIGPALFKNVGSVWAPDLVKHKNRYYIYFPGVGPYRSNYVVWADDIRGPWSAPIDLKIGRIDPGHAVGPDGKRYLFLSAGFLVPLADDGLSVTGEPKKIYDGWKYPSEWIVEGFAQEGPKVIRKGDYYYQVLAEGGTAGPPTGHMIVAARSRTIEGPWENSPYNPILRTQSSAERWWSKGHGTLVEGPGGRWFVVYHAYENGFYNLGRQTLLEPIEWLDDGWFRSARFDPDGPIPKPIASSTGEHGFAYSDDFSKNKMGLQWSFYAGNETDRERYRYEGGALVLKAKGTSPADSSPLSFVTGDHAYEIEVSIDADPGATAGLLLFYNRRLYAGLGYSDKNFFMHSYGLDRPQGKPADVGRVLHIRLKNVRNIVTIDYSVDGQTWQRYDRGMEVSGYHHNVGYDFLSLRPALYAAGAGEVRFRNFKYRALQ